MRLLYILFEEIKQSSGVSKKVLAQCNGLRANGVDVDLLSLKANKGEYLAVVNGAPIYSYGKGKLKIIRLLISFRYIIKYIKSHNINAVYVRFPRTIPCLALLFRSLKKLGVKSLLEIPTYPYDKEKFDAPNLVFGLYVRILYKLDELTRHFYKYYVDRIVTVQDYDQIFGVPTIKISNGIDLNKIPLRTCQKHKGYNLVGVAQLASWHAYERLIEGIGEYYKQGGTEDVHFYIIGNNENVSSDYMKSILKYKISDHIHLEGPKYGEELDQYFKMADFAIGSLGGHRKGLFDAKPLKCVEYAARGIPFIYSDVNTDFDNCSFIKRVSQDDTPIDVNDLLAFMEGQKTSPAEIRQFVADNLTWDIQMKKVLDEIIYEKF